MVIVRLARSIVDIANSRQSQVISRKLTATAAGAGVSLLVTGD
jgi:hypothetical protein